MPPFIFLVRIKSDGHNFFIPLPIFLLPVFWFLLLPLTAIVWILGVLMLLNRKDGKDYSTGQKLLTACKFYLKAMRLYCAFSGLKIDIKSASGQRVLLRAI